MKSKHKFSFYKETHIFLCAFSAFVLLLFFGTCITDEGGNAKTFIGVPFDMYSWHYGKAKQGNVIVADLCGRNINGDNAFIHVRKEPSGLTEVVFSLYDDNFSQGNYTIDAKFGNVHKLYKTQLRLGGKDSVLFLDRPLNIIELMKQYETFRFLLLKNRDTIDNFLFETPKPFQWD